MVNGFSRDVINRVLTLYMTKFAIRQDCIARCDFEIPLFIVPFLGTSF
jgi:hypothetical protein